MGSSASKYGQYEANRGGLSPAVVELGAEASAAFFVVFTLLYMVAHWRAWLPTVYASRRYLFPKRCLPHETPPHRRHLFSWLTDSWPVGDKAILRYYGLDALLFLRSLRLQSLATFACALYGVCVILPVNLHGKATLTSPPWGAEYTTAHIGPLASPDSPPPGPSDDPNQPPPPPPPPPADVDMEEYTKLFLVHVLGAYYMTGVVLYLLWRQYAEYVELRHAFRQRPEPENYTVLVHHIPGAMRSNAAIAAYFEALFPGSVKKVTIMLELPELEALIAKRDRVASRLEWARVVQADRSKLRCASCRSKASIDQLVEALGEELPRLEAQVQELQEELMDWHVRHERFSRRAPLPRASSDEAVPDMEEDDVDASLNDDHDEEEEEEDDEERGTTASSGASPSLAVAAAADAEADWGGLREALLPKQQQGNGNGKQQQQQRRRGGGRREEDDTTTESDAPPPAAAGAARERRSLLPPWVMERRSYAASKGKGGKRKGKGGGKGGGKRGNGGGGKGQWGSVLRRKTFRLITGNPVGAIAFVSFKSLAVASVAGQCTTYRHPLKMMSRPAPQPEDIIWDNVYMPMRQLPFKTVLGVGSSIVVTLFFSVIVGVIASLTNVQTLHDHVPFMRDFLEHSKLAQELLPYLPAFLLVLVDSTIPPILSVLARVVFREVRTVSEAHVSVFRRLYAFLMYNNFLILFLSSSLNTYYAIVEDPKRTLVELGAFLPNISSFYIAYIMIKVLCSHPMELSRMTSYFVAAFRWVLTDDLTEAQKAARILGCNHLERPGGFYYGRVYADNLFVFTITMTFALVAPLILPFALAFFLGALVVYKRQLLFVYEPEFESAGTFWPKVYRRMVAALYFMQLAILCILITNEAFKEIIWLAPLPVLTMLGSLVITKSYHDAAKHLPLAVAMETDEVNKAYHETYSFLNFSYIQPALQPLERRAAIQGASGGTGVRKVVPRPPPSQSPQQQQQARPAPPPAAAAEAARPVLQAQGSDQDKDPFSSYEPPTPTTPAGDVGVAVAVAPGKPGKRGGAAAAAAAVDGAGGRGGRGGDRSSETKQLQQEEVMEDGAGV